ncbi:branched-chain amino acid aminotransferase [Chitinophaga costaii]|uniref:branched-chain-amino-acid transaminase n=2 Tax=Chitinophaga costaii TaxID=1335309 RepID=A0A1C4BVG1_9BACT|nr:aminotransferase class IV [Chitinophaga costaii]SCC10734.1 branched-chain amino acid aminotransferase [Chitinophaga costaii]
MKVYQGRVLLEELHFERLMASVHLLHLEMPIHFTRDYLMDLVTQLCVKNKVETLARVRLSVFRTEGGLYTPENNTAEFLIQCWELHKQVFELNETGLDIDIYPESRKTCEKLSTIKSANCLPYIMAGMYAREHELNDALLLNTHGRVADATSSNVFIVRGNQVWTPPLGEGCVCGVMRKYLLALDTTLHLMEHPITVSDLENADEIFLTNTIYGIRWVERFRDNSYGNATATILHDLLQEAVL